MKKIISKILAALFIIVVLFMTTTVGFIAYLKHFAKTTAYTSNLEISERSGVSNSDFNINVDNSIKLITIHHGESLNNIADKLKTSAIIKNQYLFIALARYNGDNKKIKAGEYELSAEYTPDKILDILVNGKVKQHKITIPEGLNINEIGNILEKEGFGTNKEFIKLAADKIFIESLGIKANSLEGYLFPETYFFPAKTNQKKIAGKMVEHFNKVFTQDWKKVCEKMGFTIHEIVALASIIEKESANSAERALISSVFHNRLKIGMALQSDPTVIYGISNFNGNITKNDLLTPTPYNTYIIKGLPPGPISNPGRLSLEAALFPSKSDFLFFVSKNDSTHYFSKNIQEHNFAVRKYQLKQ